MNRPAGKNTGLLRRFGAIIYDSLLVLALLFLATIPFIALRGGEPVETNENVVYRLTIIFVIYVFFVGFWTRSGRTLGMQSWGLRVETPNGDKPSFSLANIRFISACFSWLSLGLGFLWQLWDKQNLTWHDRLSGTRVVHYRRAKKD